MKEKEDCGGWKSIQIQAECPKHFKSSCIASSEDVLASEEDREKREYSRTRDKGE